MTINIQGTKVIIDGEPDIIFQGNNLVNTLVATTDMDENWEYNIDVYMPTTNRYNSIIMTRNGNNLSVDLTRQMLPTDGRYVFQFRGQNQEAVYHTEKFDLWVQSSIDLNDGYDPMPAEFYQMENQMKELVEEAKVNGLPEITETDNDKFLQAQNGNAVWAEVPVGLTQEQADTRYLQLSGGTITGNLDFVPITSIGAPGVGQFTFTGTGISLNDGRLQHVGNAVADDDAVNLAQVSGMLPTELINSLPSQFLVDIVNVQRTQTTNTAEIQISTKQDDGTYSTSVQHGVITLIAAGMGPDGVNGAGLMTAPDKEKLDNIPAPTASDNGKVLCVENGEYVLKTLSELQGG